MRTELEWTAGGIFLPRKCGDMERSFHSLATSLGCLKGAARLIVLPIVGSYAIWSGV